MDRRINIIHPEPVLKSLADMDCGKTHFAEISPTDFELEPYEVLPPEGYEAPKQFPDCCHYHRDVLKKTGAWFEEFPQCCKHHKKLVGQPWFDKHKYSDTPNKVINQLSYTEHIIYSKFDSTEWFEEITEYIEYNFSSFGRLPAGYGTAPGLKEYIFNTQLWIKEIQHEHIRKAPDKVDRILKFINESYLQPKSSDAKIDLNILYITYQNWLKIFPFNISYFAHLRSFFEKQLPVLKNVSKGNRYSNTVTAGIMSQNELVDWLTNVTRQLTHSIRSVDLVKNKLIPDSQKHHLDLVNENHRVAVEALHLTFTKGETQYVNHLKKWLRLEKAYFKEINKLLEPSTLHSMEQQFPPVNEDVFEDFVCDVYNAVYPQSHYHRFGKKGNEQKGIDILSVIRKEAIQCKKKDLTRRSSDLKRELRKDFEADIISAMSLDAEFDLLIFTSTFEDNAGLAEYLQSLRKKLKPKFQVMYIGWGSLRKNLNGFTELIKKYYGQ